MGGERRHAGAGPGRVLVRTGALVAVASLTTAAVAVFALAAPEPLAGTPRPGAFEGLGGALALGPLSVGALPAPADAEVGREDLSGVGAPPQRPSTGQATRPQRSGLPGLRGSGSRAAGVGPGPGGGGGGGGPAFDGQASLWGSSSLAAAQELDALGLERPAAVLDAGGSGFQDAPSEPPALPAESFATPLQAPGTGPTVGDGDAGHVTVGATAWQTVALAAEPAVDAAAVPILGLPAVPTVEPAVEPVAEPTAEPPAGPVAEPTVERPEDATGELTAEPDAKPTGEVTAERPVEPAAERSVEPPFEPTVERSVEPAERSEPAADRSVEPRTEPDLELLRTEPAAGPTVPAGADPISEAPGTSTSEHLARTPGPQPSAPPAPAPQCPEPLLGGGPAVTVTEPVSTDAPGMASLDTPDDEAA